MEEQIIMKFGGASVASPERFAQIADIIALRKKGYARIVIVVSAMGDTTDQLIALAHKVNPNPPKREQDMLLTVGERISISLLAMALDLKGIKAVSLTGSQSGIITDTRHTDARIVEVRPHRIKRHLDQEKVVIVAGFQGVSRDGEITTLGRGGSDTSAVALGVALGAAKVEFYKDVEGIYEEDPKKNPQAQLFAHMTYIKALEIADRGAEVLQKRSIALAEKNRLALQVLSFNDPSRAGTLIRDDKGIKPATCIYEDL